MNKKKLLVFLAVGCLSAATSAYAGSGTSMEEIDAAILVQSYEWGPGIPKIILRMGREVSKVSAENCAVTTGGADRKVTGVYICNENGEKAEDSSCFVAIEMETLKSSGSPFTTDATVHHSIWEDEYEVTVECETFMLDGEAIQLTLSQDCIGNRICPETEQFTNRDTFTGTYMNSFTGKKEEMTLHTAAYEPDSIADGEKNPLVIWLHGQGEGGTDPDIALLGNEVCALTREEIQSCFTSGEETGAYVLAVQCETYWMDEGDGTNGKGSGISRYTEILMDTIQSYVDSNPDIDKDRIYLGGCSNGGYMTVNMLVNYPEYFAAAYPCCEAYAFYEYEREEDGSYRLEEQTEDIKEKEAGKRWVTEEKVELLKDIPIWFVVSVDDPVVPAKDFVLPTYQALVQEGAENMWLSAFETVQGMDDPDAFYMGHFSWIYLFNNQVTAVQDPKAVAAATDSELFGVTPSNDGGGSLSAGEYSNLFAWLNAQTKQ